MRPVREPAMRGVWEGVCVGPGSEIAETEDNMGKRVVAEDI